MSDDLRSKQAQPCLPAMVPHLVFQRAGEAIDFYARAFGAREGFRFSTPDGGVMHAQMSIGDAWIYLADECPMGAAKAPSTLGGTSVNIHLNLADVDAFFDKAVSEGATPIMPPADMFWGDRYGVIADPFGHVWSIATHIEDVAPDELERRSAAMFAPQPA